MKHWEKAIANSHPPSVKILAKATYMSIREWVVSTSSWKILKDARGDLFRSGQELDSLRFYHFETFYYQRSKWDFLKHWGFLKSQLKGTTAGPGTGQRKYRLKEKSQTDGQGAGWMEALSFCEKKYIKQTIPLKKSQLKWTTGEQWKFTTHAKCENK